MAKFQIYFLSLILVCHLLNSAESKDLRKNNDNDSKFKSKIDRLEKASEDYYANLSDSSPTKKPSLVKQGFKMLSTLKASLFPLHF